MSQLETSRQVIARQSDGHDSEVNATPAPRMRVLEPANSGVRAAMSNKQFGLIDNWIRHIKDVYRLHQHELDSIENLEQREDRFIELNVIEQVNDLVKTSIIQNAWAARKSPHVHGWVYDLHSGLIKDLQVTLKDNTDVQDKYKYKADNGTS